MRFVRKLLLPLVLILCFCSVKADQAVFIFTNIEDSSPNQSESQDSTEAPKEDEEGEKKDGPGEESSEDESEPTSGDSTGGTSDEEEGEETEEETESEFESESDTEQSRIRLSSLTIIKQDAMENPVAGVCYALTDENGNPVADGQTDENGSVTFSDLEAGVYILEETKTVEGEQLLGVVLTVTLPLVLTQEEMETYGDLNLENAVVDEDAGTATFYDLTYVITSSAKLTMPVAGSKTDRSLVWLGVAMAVAAFAMGIFIRRRMDE